MASCYYTIIWKGADGTLYIPFDGEEFDDIDLKLSTTGDSIVEVSDFEVHDNFIVVPIESGQLDLLPDGVIRYALTIDGVTDAGNLNAVLKTPDGYDGETADDIYQRGYEDGLRDCSGNTGYERGYEDGFRDGLDSGFTAGYQSGFTDGLAACSGDTPSSGDTPTSGDTPLSGDYLTFELLSDGTIHFARRGDDTEVRYYDRVNGGEWVEHVFSGSSTQVAHLTISGQVGDIIEFKGDVPSGSAVGAFIAGDSITHTGAMYKVYGNIMSFIDSTGYTTATALTTSGFNSFFHYCTGLTDASNLILPTTTLPDCYGKMFIGCTNLTTAPELPATILAENSYNQIFSGCTNLNYIKCLATDISANGSTYNWVGGVAASGTFVKNSSMTGWTYGSDGIPEGWTVVDAS